MRYRLALDLGSTSLGWAIFRIDDNHQPVALIRAGVRIFGDGRNPKDGSSLAVTRREARAMRRRRDRLLRRKARMLELLQAYNFFPTDDAERKALERLNPYQLRAEGLGRALTPAEFGRALFHMNQRRGFKSNRKTDQGASDTGALKTAIAHVRQAIDPLGTDGKPRTVGELLWQRMQNGHTVRAKNNGLAGSKLMYDLYIDRAMIDAEFDALWASQAQHNPAQFHDTARDRLKDCLLFQRKLRPVRPGRCTLLPEEERAPLALPSQQRFRMLQELNHLRIQRAGQPDEALTLAQRNLLLAELERKPKLTFAKIKTLLKLPASATFSHEDEKRQELKGNVTACILSKPQLLGTLGWHELGLPEQDAMVMQLLTEEHEGALVAWLQQHTGVDEATAEALAHTALPEGYGSLSAAALARIVPALERDVVTYDKAVQAAGFDHHSQLSHAASTGEILPELPYYGEYLTRHVGFADPRALPDDLPEKRFGRIANPTVHIGLNQVRKVVNALLRRYGHPTEVVIEVARDLKQSREQRQDEQKRQASNQRRNERLRAEAAAVLGIAIERVRHADIEKLILWEELARDPLERRCPYSGHLISARAALSDEVEVEHILPFSQTLDDSLNNKTLALRLANRIKGNRTPWEARHDFAAQGWDYDGLLQRASVMPKPKRERFEPDGLQRWLKDNDFLARALNDTRYLSRVAREYLSLICPQATRAIPGQMTALLRAKFGLNDILGLKGEKNRNDHRHHAVDACVIGVTDQGLLQRFAQASASTRQHQLGKLVDNMPLPWPTYREHVARAIHAIWVSHKPDHGHEGAMHNDTAYGLLGNGHVRVTKHIDGQRVRDVVALKVIEFADARATQRHGTLPDGSPKPYKGYKGDSNYCMEIVRNPQGKWEGEVISTFAAYQLVRQHGLQRLRAPSLSASGKPLVMRLMIDDTVRLTHNGEVLTLRVVNISANTQVFMAPLHEANVDARNRSKDDPFQYISKMPGSLQKSQGRKIAISPTGELNDPGFQG